jgi:hypothetical protein
VFLYLGEGAPNHIGALHQGVEDFRQAVPAFQDVLKHLLHRMDKILELDKTHHPGVSFKRMQSAQRIANEFLAGGPPLKGHQRTIKHGQMRFRVEEKILYKLPIIHDLPRPSGQ